LDAAGDAALVVVQRQAGSTLHRLVAGSTASTVAAQAPCPVVVVHAGDQPFEPGGIVVGVDRRGSSGQAVQLAAMEASWRGVPLTAVQAWEAGLETSASEGGSLAEAVADLQGRYPQVVLRQQLIHGDPVKALIESSRQALLIVVGRRASSHLATLGLGHVARALIGRAHCPVMVALPDPRPYDRRAALAQPVSPWTGY
jgi:nucleotide-binding universal stress UspA family protein